MREAEAPVERNDFGKMPKQVGANQKLRVYVCLCVCSRSFYYIIAEKFTHARHSFGQASSQHACCAVLIPTEATANEQAPDEQKKEYKKEVKLSLGNLTVFGLGE